MFDQRHKGKIKNDKIMRWRVELSCYSFDIIYHPGKKNIPPDTFHVVLVLLPKLTLCINCINLFVTLVLQGCPILFVLETYLFQLKISITNSCQIFCECKPRYHQPDRSFLIKSTQPFDRLNIDFKGPLPSSNKNVYFL